ncbi:MAG: DUF362 domain-containing protein [Desulfatiglans sp.]|jgi:uncharacterized protein (DUF362 family)|nr:DUF362 domain-containing protein [Desulfatiglans sp.]
MTTGSGSNLVSIVRYDKPLESVRKVIELCQGLENIRAGAKIFIKPNVVFWSRSVTFPKWGVITTSRVMEDIVTLLVERGFSDITIGEGMVTYDPKDRETHEDAFEKLGYNKLSKRYGVKCINVHDRPFKKVDLGQGVALKFNTDILESDFVIDVPVLKTHAQAVVSLGIKNLKGVLDISSRKKCHSNDRDKDLHYMVSKLASPLPPCLTILDGIYTIERGPSFDGTARRSNILIASTDILSADMVGANVLGFEPKEVPHIHAMAEDCGRPTDLSDIHVAGESIEAVASHHEYLFPYTEDETLPVPMKKMGIEGLSYRKYDVSLCTYCSFLNGPILAAIAKLWKGEPWDDVEVLTGKMMKPTPGMKKTILLGKCIYQANKDNPDINEMIAVKGCPPSTKQIIEAFHQAGIPIDPVFLEDMDKIPGFFMKSYLGKPEFEESFFTVE